MNKKALTKLSFVAIALLSVLGVFVVLPVIKSAETPYEEKSETGQATITKQVAIGLSTNLDTDGVRFTNLDPGSSNNAAEHSADGGSSETTYYVEISSSTNTPIDICTKTNQDLTFGSYDIDNSNFKWNVTTTATADDPSLPGNAFTGDFSYDTTNLVADDQDSGTHYLRFWLTVPAAQRAGTYTNTIYWCANENSTTCDCA